MPKCCYLIAFDPYQGKTYQCDKVLEKQFEKCASTILSILESYSENKKMYPYHFYFDNLFNTLPLLAELKNRGNNGTGTLRVNRLDASCPIPSIATSDKKDRGFSASVTGTVGPSTIMVTRWKDNAVVTVASTVH